jgi:hypothetical protein
VLKPAFAPATAGEWIPILIVALQIIPLDR